MSKDQILGALITIVCVVLAVGYTGLLFAYDPYIKGIINLGSADSVHYWLIAIPVFIVLIGILAVGAWVGYTMATTPPPKPIEEITTETKTEETKV